MSKEHLATYLNDHLMGAVAAIELVDQLASEATDLKPFLEGLKAGTNHSWAIYKYISCLPDPVGAVSGLILLRGIPWSREMNHVIGRLDIYAKPYRRGRKHDHAKTGGGLEPVNHSLSGFIVSRVD